MSRLMSTAVSIALLASLLVPMTACGPSTPEGKIAQIRAGYKIELNTWKPIKAEAPPAEEAAEGEAAAEEAAMASADEAGEEAAEAQVEAGPVATDILLDLVVFFRGRKSLPGVTVDITHASAAETEKGTYRHFVDTAGIVNGETRQASVKLEDVPFEEGDRFAVALVAGIPADLSEYREFSEPAP